ncbi:MAG: glycerophosphodiester phosphodiesterase [Actinobacteria bacterium]|nr:glycerophosphodiester phosphodiesterase [Actinomycetota bacterium]
MSERPFSQEMPLVVAHRGASAVEAENTLEAFEAALAAGADAVEFDVRLTADGVPVVIHDPEVDRTTDGSGVVRAMSLAELKRLRIRTAAGGSAEVPSLVETLALLSGRATVDIEIKNIPGEPDFDAGGEPVVEATLRAVEEVGFVGTVLVSSFNPSSIARSRALAPGVPTGLLTIDGIGAPAALAAARDAAHPWVLPAAESVLSAGEGFLREARTAGMRVGTWIVDRPEPALRLMRWGIDAVATNDPATIARARRELFA